MPIEEDDGEMDIYAALGLNTPVGPQEGSASPGAFTEPYDQSLIHNSEPTRRN